MSELRRTPDSVGITSSNQVCILCQYGAVAHSTQGPQSYMVTEAENAYLNLLYLDNLVVVVWRSGGARRYRSAK